MKYIFWYWKHKNEGMIKEQAYGNLIQKLY